MEQTNKPNIIFIQNDHQAYYRWGWDGGLGPQRPNFERLAKSGVQFTNAYCATPLCGPTRRSLLTGLYAHTHGQYHNYTDPSYDHEVYLDTLAEAGYKNYYFGKWHAGPGNANDHHCEGCSAWDYGNPYLWDSYEDYLKRYHLPRAVHRIHRVFDVPHFYTDGFFAGLTDGADYKCESSWCGEHCVGTTTTPKETHESFFLANLACETLEQLAKKDNQDQPFTLRVDFWGPHQPHFPTQEYLDMYPADSFDPPVYGSLHDDLATKPPFYKRERSHPFGSDDIIVQPSPVPWDEWKEIIRRCFAHITMLDAAAGRILDKLRELGLDKNTLIIYTTDHGDALASHGGHFDKGSYMSEEVMRIPCAMAWPGKIAPGQVRDEYVCSVDYPVTILDAAKTAFTKNPVHGRSLLPLAMGATANWREDVVCETYGHGYGEDVVSRMIVHGPYKYIATDGFTHELYNLEDDPFELKNQIDNPDFAVILKDLRDRLAHWQVETGDPANVL